MGRVTDIAEIETAENRFKVQMWKGTGTTFKSQYEKPCYLLKLREDWEVVEEWSGKYSPSQKPRKTKNQILSEAVKKLRFYDKTTIEALDFQKHSFNISERNIYFFQPSITTRNTKKELYRVGASQISQKFSPADINLAEKVKKIAEKPATIYLWENGDVQETLRIG